MKTCECGKKMVQKVGKTQDGISYNYFSCNKCGEEVLDMKQLHSVAKKYREMKNYRAKVNRWGLSLGIRIPKDLAKKYNLKNNSEVSMIADKNGILIVP